MDPQAWPEYCASANKADKSMMYHFSQDQDRVRRKPLRVGAQKDLNCNSFLDTNLILLEHSSVLRGGTSNAAQI
eukprot:1159235-Pelagomonas_calceolata.AAC.15